MQMQGKKTHKAPRFDILGGLFAENKIKLTHPSIAYVCFTALDPGAELLANSPAAGARERVPGGGQPVPLRSSTWVSGNWVLKSGPTRIECPRGPGWAPAPGELARAERFRSSAGRPDSSATLKTSLCPTLQAKTAAGAEPFLAQSWTLRPADSTTPLCPAISPPAKCWSLREGGSAWPRARAGFGFGAAGLALEERCPLLPRAHELKFCAHWVLGVLETGNSGFPEGLKNDVGGPRIFRGSGLRRAGTDQFPGPREKRGAPAEGTGAVCSGNLRAEVGKEAVAQGAHGGCPRKGARAAARARPARCGWGAGSRGRGLRAPLTPSPVPPRRGVRARRRREHAPRPGAPPESGAGCRAFSGPGGSPGRPAGRGSSLPEQREAPGLADPGRGPGLGPPRGRRPARASYPSRAVAAAVAAPATACPALAAMPALGGEEMFITAPFKSPQLSLWSLT
ncbi:uncharacterized protein [Manis javanica]|uniref:uncharacterized protein n=1 Tax=Manis javanica TaxID=9974 RepID=UPI003C6D8E8A